MSAPKLNFNKSDWTPVTFGDVAFEPKESVKDARAAGIEHVVGLEHIGSEDIHLRRSNGIDESTTFTKKFSEGDVLFGRRRAYLKKAAQAPFEGICSGDITVMRAKDNLLPELLPFIVNNDKFFDWAITHSAGGLSPRCKFKDLANYEFLLPPKEQQAEIAQLLWAADSMIQKALGVVLSINDSFEPLIEGMILSVPFSDRQLGELVEASEIDLLTGPFGTVLSAKSYSESGVPIINPCHISQGNIDTTRGPFVPEELIPKLSRYKMTAGDIIVGRKGEVGRCAYIDKSVEGILVGSDCIRFRVLGDSIDPHFLYTYMNLGRIERWFERYSYGTTMPGINEKTLCRMPLQIPSVHEQSKIVRQHKIHNERLAQANEHVETSKALQKSLINQVF